MRIRLSIALCALLSGIAVTSNAQTTEDSLAFANAHWNIILDSTGVLCRQADLQVFGTEQKVSVLELSPDYFQIKIVQLEKRATPAKAARKNDALMSVNAGFFQTNTKRSVANDYLKIKDSVYYSAGGWASAAMAIDREGGIHFTNEATDKDWQERYPNVIAAGPMIIKDAQRIWPLDTTDKVRHPRTLIGTKADGTIVMMVIDGRRAGMDGMSNGEMSYTAYALGLDNCINLDGGGSSAMWIKRMGIINNPSDRVLFITIPRKVANSIVVHRR